MRNSDPGKKSIRLPIQKQLTQQYQLMVVYLCDREGERDRERERVCSSQREQIQKKKPTPQQFLISLAKHRWGRKQTVSSSSPNSGSWLARRIHTYHPPAIIKNFSDCF